MANSQKIIFSLVGALALVVTATAMVYLRTPTDGPVRAIVGLFPYPAAVVGADVITVREYLEERDALDGYFKTSAGETSSTPTEEEIAQNIIETLVHKSAVNRLADLSGVVVDETRVEAFYQQAVGNTDAGEFATQLESMFGWSADEFRARVVRPVVLAIQLGEQIERDAARQEGRRQKIQVAYDRLVAGDEFAAVASDASETFSATSGGDVGYVSMAEIPPEWVEIVTSLPISSYSGVIEGIESFVIFQVTDRVEAGEDTEVRLSLISVPKVTLEEVVQEYLDSVRVWKLIGRT